MRGEETRRRILDAAIAAFAEVGYEAAHTRLIADRASVKLPAIAYYFGSKEGLYRAVIQHITDQYEKRMAPVAQRVQALLADATASREDVLDLLCELLENLTDVLLRPTNPESWRQLIVRAEVENVSGLAPLRDCMRQNTGHPCMALISRLTGEPQDTEQTWMRAIALLGEINIFTKPQVRGSLGWTEYTDERIRAIQTLVCTNARSIFATLGSTEE
ncbi:MAG TPA: CerR family C-terminal domain-containing protein [Magnetospirillaceae bacterium]|jgi:AcrR family transcriptional regulator